MTEQQTLALEQTLRGWLEKDWLTEELIAGVVIAVLALIAVSVICWILQIVANWKIFTKAGEKGWKTLIPLYRGHVLYGLIWKPVMYWILAAAALVEFLLMGQMSWPAILVNAACSCACMVIMMMANLKLARAFGRGDGFAVGLIFLPTIFTLILAFGKSKYIGVEGKAAEIAEE